MEIDYGDIQTALDQITAGGKRMDFGGMVAELMENGDILSAKGLLGVFGELLRADMSGYRSFFLQVIGIAVGAAMLKGLTEHFQDRQVGETGFFMTYLLLFAVLLSGFTLSYQLAAKTIGDVVTFMECLIPTYFLSVAFCTGSATSLIFYQGTLLAIGLVEMILQKLLLPLVNVYLVLKLTDYFTKEESLGELAELVHQVIRWGARTLFGLVAGIQTVQGLILPMSDKVKRSLLYKTAEMLPGVGNLVGGAAETVITTGMLLKNAIGVAGLLVLVSLILVPIGNLLCQYLICKLSAGVLQPISDKRITGSLSAAAQAARLLLYLTGLTALLFALAISVTAASTSIG